MRRAADHPLLAVGVHRIPALGLAEGLGGRDAARGGAEEALHRGVLGPRDVPMRQGLGHRTRVDGGEAAVDQPGALQLAHDAHDAAGAMDVLDMHVGDRGRHLAEHRHPAGEPVDIGHGEVDLGLMRRRQQVQHRVGGAPHGDVEGHRILEGGPPGDGARQDGIIVLLVVPLGQPHDQPAGFQEQLLPVGMGRQHRAVAGQRQAQRLGQAVHRIGGEHARAGAAGRAGGPLDHRDLLVRHRRVGGDDHGVDQVDRALDPAMHHLAGLHRPARDEHHGDVQPHRRHQHAGRDLVAVRDADEGIGAMRVDHVLDRIGDQLARRQAVQHAAMAHGDAVIDGDGVELLGHAAGRLDLPRDHLAQVLQVDMAGDELGEANWRWR